MALHHVIHKQSKQPYERLYVFSLGFAQSLILLTHALGQNHQPTHEILTCGRSRLFIRLDDHFGDAYKDCKYGFGRRKILRQCCIPFQRVGVGDGSG